MCTVGTPAYLKVMMHAAKHPHCAVNGLLLGSGGGATVRVVDAVPLFHQHTLGPMLEAATLIVEKYCEEEATTGHYGAKVQIVGYYHANERVDDTERKPLVRQIHAKVNDNFPGAVLLMVNNAALASGTSVALDAFHKGGGGDEDLSACSVALEDPGCMELLTSSLVDGAEAQVVDFDEHFFDVSNDWRNRAIQG